MDCNYIGLDVHQASTTIVVINKRGKMIQELVMQTNGQQLRSHIASVKGRKEITLEEGCMSDWLYTLLGPVVDRIVVCDPTENRKILSGKKSDSLDARHLAELLRGGYLKEVFHKTHPMDSLRSCLKTYLVITRDLTRCKNRLKALFRSRGIKTDSSLYHPDNRRYHIDLLDRLAEKERSIYLFEQLDILSGQKERAEQSLISQARKHKGYRLLKSVPGFGPIHAATVLAIVVTPHRFRTKRLFWSYCGLAVVKRSSSDWIEGKEGLELRRREQTLGLNWNRNPVMKYVFKQAALVAIQSTPFKEYYDFHVEKGLNAALARVTVARKLAAVTLCIWKKGVRFDQDQILGNLS